MKKIFLFVIIVSVLYISYILLRNITISPLTSSYRQIGSLSKTTSSDIWLIVTSITQLQQWLNSSYGDISIIFIDNSQHSLPSFRNANIIILNSQLRSQVPFRSTNIRIIAYLLAISYGARSIYELDPNLSFHPPPPHHQRIEHVTFRRQRSPFINIYPTFTANVTSCSPGLPKEELTNITQDGWSSIRTVDTDHETIHPLIQQQISPLYQNKVSLVNHPPVAAESFTFAPFSSKNVLFTYDAFWGLVLFESKSDIWRSWWVQRLLWDINGHVAFACFSNQTNITRTIDTDQDVKEDANVGKLVRYLSTWNSTKKTLTERIKQLISDTIDQQFSEANDLNVIQAWLDDLKQIKYVFPQIKSSASEKTASSKVRRRRVAVCMTGVVECIEEAWRPAANTIRARIQGEIDVFMYLSSTEPVVDQLATMSLQLRLIEALRYSNFRMKVLFEDIPILDSHFVPNCSNQSNFDLPRHKIPRYYQQLLALSNCFSLVHDYEKKHNIKYDLMVRTRADITFLKISSTFDRAPPYDINKTLILPPNLYASKVDDEFAMGPMDALEVYMNRYYSLQKCLTRDIHPERYLAFYLTYQKVNWIVDQSIRVKAVPHGPNHCH